MPVFAKDQASSYFYAQNATYAPHGALASLQNGTTSLTSTFIYNNRLQPCWLYATTGTPLPVSGTNCGSSATNATILDLKYDFDPGVANNGNVKQIINRRDTNRSQTFTYDELNRIKTAQSQAASGPHAWGLQFAYDIWANLLSASVTQGSAPTLSVVATTMNQIAGFCYDAAGNLLAESAPPCPVPTYAYDAENRMTTATGVTYAYDGDGKRLQKSTGKLYWYGMGEEVLLETNVSGALTDEFIFFNGNRIARRDTSSNIFFYFTDNLGTSRAIVQAGQPNACYDADFYPFGGERSPITDTCPQPYKFTGKERDVESNLDFFIARYYSSNFGRFLSPDPGNASGFENIEDPLSWNAYAYARNNPLKYIDPDGLNYLVCGPQGKDCAHLDNYDYEEWRKANPSIYATPSGDLFQINADGSETFLGTATYYDENVARELENAGRMAEAILWGFVKEAVQDAGDTAILAAVPPVGIVVKAKKVVRVVKFLAKADSPIWKGLKTYRGPIKATGKGRTRRYYKWDHTHSNIEVFDRNGKHLGVQDPITGTVDYTQRIQGRSIKNEL